MNERPWDRGTRLLHMGLAGTVTFQLFISLVMEPPEPGHAISGGEHFAFELHEGVGMAALAVVIVHWFWVVLRDHGAALRQLFPIDKAGIAELASDIQGLLQGRLPEGGPRGGLAGLIHGLGFLAVTGMVTTGAVIFFLLPENGAGSSLVHGVEELHEGIATLVWVYWCGHVGMALLHQLRGHAVLPGMFKLWG